MRFHTATGCRTRRTGRNLLLALPALVALAACTNPTSTTSTNASAGATRVGDNTGAGGTHSVNAVSDALGQRLDAMVSARQTGTGLNR
jgi:hypothetical protein